MRLARLAVLILPISLAACGGSAAPAGLSVSCGGSTSLNGAPSIDVAPAAAANGGAVLSFPDPANKGHMGTIAIAPGSKCTINPTQMVTG